MTEKYTPEKVAELVAEAREEDWHVAGFSNTLRLMHELADALTVVSADRDRLHKAITEALACPVRIPERSPLVAWPDYKDEMRCILRAALDKEGQGDEHPHR